MTDVATARAMLRMAEDNVRTAERFLDRAKRNLDAAIAKASADGTINVTDQAAGTDTTWAETRG